jgi:hypothetical protein
MLSDLNPPATLDELDIAVELAVAQGHLESGVPARWVAANSRVPHAAAILAGQPRAKNAGRRKRARAPEWSHEHDLYLIQHLGFESEGEIARQLGRTVTAVHLRWKRDLRLPAPSKDPRWLTGQRVAHLLGIDIHSVMHLIDGGRLPGRLLPGRRRIRVVERQTLLLWIINPLNWMCFKFEKVRDAKLRRLLEIRKARWNDEWWPIGRVAAHHRVDHATINAALHRQKLIGVKYGNWWIRRSEALRPGQRFFRGKGRTLLSWSERADCFILLAAGVGLPADGIARRMGPEWNASRVQFRLRDLHRRRQVQSLIRKHQLTVQYNPTTGALLADWKLYRRRFKRLAEAMRRFRERRALSEDDRRYVRGVLRAWAAWRARSPEQYRREKMRCCGGWARTTGDLRRANQFLVTQRMDPLHERLSHRQGTK